MKSEEKLRVGVVGCGMIAWIHLTHLLGQGLGEVVGICDFDQRQLERTAGQFRIAHAYQEFDQMLREQRPDVVHVTTPPMTHADLAIRAMEAGAHVLIEKPMAATVAEADRILAAARRTGKTVCVDHNRLFSPGTLAARRMLDSGELGELVSVEFFQGYGLPPGQTAAALGRHWVGRLPGGLVEDLAPHCLSFLAHFCGPLQEFHAVARPNGLLPVAPCEEVRMVVKGERALGVGTISLTAAPFANYLVLHGSRRTVRYNLDNLTFLTKTERFSHPLVQKLLGSVDEGLQLIRGACANGWAVARGRLPRYPDILEVIARFYRSIREGTAPPVSAEAGRQVVALIERLVETMVAARASASPSLAPAAEAPAEPLAAGLEPATILITGAAGLVGGALLERLLVSGQRPRILLRPSMRAERLANCGAEIVWGDITDPAAVARAMAGIETVFHLAARMGSQGRWEEFERDNVTGTRVVMAAAAQGAVKRFLFLSSLGVYGRPARGNVIDEQAPYESDPASRGFYSASKLMAEKLVLEQARASGLATTIFRPGIVYGPGRPLPVAPIAIPLGRKIVVVGHRDGLLPLCYIENLIDALLAALANPQTIGRQYNLVDDELLSNAQWHRLRAQLDGSAATFLPPLPFQMAAPLLQPILARRGGRLAAFSPHALANAVKSVRYDTSLAQHDLGWHARVPAAEAIAATLRLGARRAEPSVGSPRPAAQPTH